LRTFGGLGVSLFTGSVIAFVLGVADAGVSLQFLSSS
jgi:hypothetical protein